MSVFSVYLGWIFSFQMLLYWGFIHKNIVSKVISILIKEFIFIRWLLLLLLWNTWITWRSWDIEFPKRLLFLEILYQSQLLLLLVAFDHLFDFLHRHFKSAGRVIGIDRATLFVFSLRLLEAIQTDVSFWFLFYPIIMGRMIIQKSYNLLLKYRWIKIHLFPGSLHPSINHTYSLGVFSCCFYMIFQ